MVPDPDDDVKRKNRIDSTQQEVVTDTDNGKKDGASLMPDNNRSWSGSDRTSAAVANSHPELFDVDVIKGAVGYNTKPKHNPTLLRKGICRVVLFPFYCRFWCNKIGPAAYTGYSVLFCLQSIAVYIYLLRCDIDTSFTGNAELICFVMFGSFLDRSSVDNEN